MDSAEDSFSEIILHQLDSDNEYIEMDEVMKDWPENWETQFIRTEGVEPDSGSYYKNDTFSLEDEENCVSSAARVGGKVYPGPEEGPSEIPSGRGSGIVLSPRSNSFTINPNQSDIVPKRNRQKKLSLIGSLGGGKEKSAPLKEKCVKSTTSRDKSAAIRNGILKQKEERRTLDTVSKEDLVRMWRRSEYQLSKEVKKLKDEKALLEIKLKAVGDVNEFTDCHWV
jgi:hypothetical protein